MTTVQPRLLLLWESGLHDFGNPGLEWIMPAAPPTMGADEGSARSPIAALIGAAEAVIGACRARGVGQAVVTDDWEEILGAGRHSADLRWLPRWEVIKPRVQFAFSREAYGDGFKTFRADPATVKGGYRLAEGGMSLDGLLAQAREARLPAVWLHSPEADRRRKGLDLDLLEFVSRRFYGNIWLSGGASEPRHLSNYAGEAGAHTLVVPASLVGELGAQACCQALTAPPPPRLSRLLHSLRTEVNAS